jgi:hypothetical protein
LKQQKGPGGFGERVPAIFDGLQNVKSAAFRGVAHWQLLIEWLGRKVATRTLYFMVYDAIGGSRR